MTYQTDYDRTIERLERRKEQIANFQVEIFPGVEVTFEDRVRWEESIQAIEHQLAQLEIKSIRGNVYYAAGKAMIWHTTYIRQFYTTFDAINRPYR